MSLFLSRRMTFFWFRLEDVLGSFRVAVLTAAAAASAEVVACFALFALSQNSSRESKRVGFSGILFSWVVVAAVAMPNYCVFGNACFTTFQFLGARLNVGPLFLAAAIQLVVPRASLIGHAAGIAVGFPLSWGLLDFLTPPVIATFLAVLDACLVVVGTPRSLSLRPCLAASLQACAGFLCMAFFPRQSSTSFLAVTNLAAALSSLVSTKANHTSMLLLPFVHALSFSALAGAIRHGTNHHAAALAAAALHATTAILFAQDYARHFTGIPPNDNSGPAGKHVAAALRRVDALSVGRRSILIRQPHKTTTTTIPFSGAGNVVCGGAQQKQQLSLAPTPAEVVA